MRVVADTNVLVSALIFPGGAPEAFYRLALERRIELVTSRPLLVELGRVLTEKFGWDAERTEEAVGQLIRIARIVAPRETISEIAADPADDRVLEAAAEVSRRRRRVTRSLRLQDDTPDGKPPTAHVVRPGLRASRDDPRHDVLKVGTLALILADVATYLERDRYDVTDELFGR